MIKNHKISNKLSIVKAKIIVKLTLNYQVSCA